MAPATRVNSRAAFLYPNFPLETEIYYSPKALLFFCPAKMLSTDFHPPFPSCMVPSLKGKGKEKGPHLKRLWSVKAKQRTGTSCTVKDETVS